MKILILGFTKIKYMPYLNFYIDNIDLIRNEVHLLYWNRDLKNETTDHLSNLILHEYRCFQRDDTLKLKKINSFINYRYFAINLLKENQYDVIIFLHSLPGILISDILIAHYKYKYIFDYRDSTFERFTLFKQIIGRLVKYSKLTFVSSDAFRKYLPKSEENKIYTTHNLLVDSLTHIKDKDNFGISSSKVRIGFWGFIRDEKINRQIIQKIGKDNRFELHFYGREQRIVKNLKIYSAEINAENVFFHGEYKPSDRYQFILKTDLIHNIYNDKNMMLALGNKYYDGIIFRIPQICFTESYMGKLVTKLSIGLECDPYQEDFTDLIYDYYMNLKEKEFKSNCEHELERINSEYEKSCKLIQI